MGQSGKHFGAQVEAIGVEQASTQAGDRGVDRRLGPLRLLAMVAFGFALTLLSNTLEPALLGRKVLQLAPDRPNTALGFATFAGVLAAIITQPIVGVLSDRTCSRWGRRLPYITLGTLLLLAALCLVVAAPAFAALVLGVLLLQLASNILQGPWQALTPDMVPASQRGQVAGLKAMLDVVAVIIGRQSAGMLVGRYAEWGELALFAAIGVPGAALLGALLVTFRYAREPAGRPASAGALASAPHDQAARAGRPRVAGARPSLRVELAASFRVDLRAYPAFTWWFLNRLLFWMAFILLSTFQLFFIIDVVGLSEAQAQQSIGELSLALGGALALIVLPAGWLSNRLGRKPLLVVAGLVTALGTALLLPARELSTLLVAGGINGLGIGIFLSASWALIVDIVPRDEAARYLGVANIASAGGSALARLLGGMLIDPLNAAFGSRSAGYLAMYALAALLFLLSALAILPLRMARPGD